MQCLYVTGTIAKCPLKRGACLWEVKMQCLYVTGTIAKCPLKRGRLKMLCLYAGGVRLQEVSNSRSFTTYSSFLILQKATQLQCMDVALRSSILPSRILFGVASSLITRIVKVCCIVKK